jgi:hypothetical protein
LNLLRPVLQTGALPVSYPGKEDRGNRTLTLWMAPRGSTLELCPREAGGGDRTLIHCLEGSNTGRCTTPARIVGEGIEPSSSPYQRDALPLSYPTSRAPDMTRTCIVRLRLPGSKPGPVRGRETKNPEVLSDLGAADAMMASAVTPEVRYKNGKWTATGIGASPADPDRTRPAST